MDTQRMDSVQVRDATARLLGGDESLDYITDDYLNAEAEEAKGYAEERDGDQPIRVVYGHALSVGYRDGKSTFEFLRGGDWTTGCGEVYRSYVFQECWTYARVGTCTNGGATSGHIKFTLRTGCW